MPAFVFFSLSISTSLGMCWVFIGWDNKCNLFTKLTIVSFHDQLSKNNCTLQIPGDHKLRVPGAEVPQVCEAAGGGLLHPADGPVHGHSGVCTGPGLVAGKHDQS